MDQDMQTVIMQLIINSGDARSKAMLAIASAKQGDVATARKQLDEADELLTKAHQFQTEIIQDEARGNSKPVTILLAHAQDHLMNAITVMDMSREFVDLYEELSAGRAARSKDGAAPASGSTVSITSARKTKRAMKSGKRSDTHH